MPQTTGTAQSVVRRSYVAQGVRLDVIAERAGADGWCLSIGNELGTRSVWIETFATTQAALDAGVKAIESEGVEAFLDTEGFEYLLED